MTANLIELLEIFGRAAMVGIVASITVGPVAVLCIQRTISKSRRSGLVSGLGIATADTLMAVAAYFFYAMLQGHIEAYEIWLRVIGGIFVIGMGVYIFLQNPVPQIKKNRKGRKDNWWHDFISIFGLTLANFVMVIPYILAFFAVFKISSVVAESAEEARASFKGLAVCIGFFVGSLAWWTSLTTIINLFRTRFKPRHMLTINHIAGLVISSLGAYTIISTVVMIISRQG